ncbi:MAG: Zn-ribbon domain-containing OB-fold protein [archaeon]
MAQDQARPLTIDSFFKYCSEGKLMASACKVCNRLWIPPRQLCPSCMSSDLSWTQLSGTGELLSFTEVQVGPPAFQSQVPYIIGIVRLSEGTTLSGLIRETTADKLTVGMPLKVQFESLESKGWQPASRYYFVPA